MLRTSIVFFAIGLLAYLIGANNFAGFSSELGTTLFWVFIALSVVALIVSFFTNTRTPRPLVRPNGHHKSMT